MDFKKILVALCGRGDERRVIETAVYLAQTHSASLAAIHVNEPHAGEISMMMDSPGPKLDENAIRERFRMRGFDDLAEGLEVQVITAANIQKAIIKAAEGMDLLVVGHRQPGFFKEHFSDSMEEGLINHITCPVVVVPKS